MHVFNAITVPEAVYRHAAFPFSRLLFLVHPLLYVNTHTRAGLLTSMQFDMWPKAKHFSLMSLLPPVSPGEPKED